MGRVCETPVKPSNDQFGLAIDDGVERPRKDALESLSMVDAESSVNESEPVDHDGHDGQDGYSDGTGSTDRKSVRCPLGKRPKRRRRVSGPMVGVVIDDVTRRRLCRVKAFVEFASGESYMMSDLMMKVVTKGLDVVERELKMVDSAADLTSCQQPSGDSAAADSSQVDVKPIKVEGQLS